MQAMSDKIDKKTTRQDITASEEGNNIYFINFKKINIEKF
jgi:hypothetical protein